MVGIHNKTDVNAKNKQRVGCSTVAINRPQVKGIYFSNDATLLRNEVSYQ